MTTNFLIINGVEITRKKRENGTFECIMQTKDGYIYFNVCGKYTAAHKFGEISAPMFDIFIREYSNAMGYELVSGVSL